MSLPPLPPPDAPVTLSHVQTALAERRITPHFQPIVAVETGQLRGFEVLARWHDAERGWISPEVFIPLARSGGAIARLTQAIVCCACRSAVTWPGDFYLSFNMPPGLLQDEDAVRTILQAATAAGFPLQRLRIEMTEVEVVEDEAATEATVRHLKDVGIKTMLDDFGAGYSSLLRLHRYQFHKIKIDAGFIRTLETDEASRKIVAAIVGLGSSLGAKVVAEGVATPFQLNFLSSIGCDAYQGWLLSPALDAGQAAAWLGTYRPSTTTTSAFGPQLSPYQRQYQLEILYERSPVGLCFIDPELRFIDANRHFCGMIGRTPHDIVGRTLNQVLGRALGGQATDLVTKSIADGISGLREITLPGRSDTYLINHDRVLDAAGVVLGVSVVCIDISDRKRYESALRAREESDLTAVVINPTVMWVADTSGALSYISPHALDTVGAPLQQRIQAWYNRMHPQDRLRVREEWLASSATATRFKTRFRLRGKGSDWRWVASRAQRRSQEPGSLWFGLFTDITREVELEARLAELLAEPPPVYADATPA